MTTLYHHRLRWRLEGFVDGELDRDAAELVGAHVRAGWWCSGDVQTLRLLKAVLRRLARTVPEP